MPPSTMHTAAAHGLADPRHRARLARNLAALEEVDPELAERLRWPVDDAKVRLAEDGRWLYRLHRQEVRLDVAEPEALVRAALAERDPDERGARVLLLGIGSGELLPPLVAAAERVVAWDADPWHLRLALARFDLAGPIRRGALGFALGTDLMELAGERFHEVRHPLLAELHRGTLAAARDRSAAPRAMLAAGGLFVDEVRTALVRRGWRVWTIDVQGLAREELSRSLRRFRPALLFCVNAVEGLAEFAAGAGVPLVVWEVDPALAPPRRLQPLLPGARGARDARVFTYREASASAYRAAGYARVSVLPLAADPELRRPLELSPEERERYGAPVAFVGSSMVANARRLRARALELWTAFLGGGEPAAARAAAGFQSVLERQRRTPGEDRLAALLEEQAPGLLAAAAGRGVDLRVLVGESAAAEKRLSAIANLGALEVSVWGDEGWSALARHGVRWRGYAGHREELTRIYNAVAVHVDVARLYQNDIVPMRVFDVLACEGFLIAEHSEELARLFAVGRELETWRTLDELRAKVTHYLAHPAEARAIARRGRQAVLERHTIEQRLERMLADRPV